MGYSRPMGFCMQIPAHRAGGPEKVWDTRGYGLSEVCVMTGSTVAVIGIVSVARPTSATNLSLHNLGRLVFMHGLLYRP